MNKILVFLFVLTANISFSQTWNDSKVTVDSIQLSKDQIYDKAKVAVFELFNSGKASIELDDKANGILIGRGSFLTHDIKNGFGQILGSRSIFFKYTIEVKDRKYRITISDHTHEKIGRFDGSRPPHPSGDGKISEKQWLKYKSECDENASKTIASFKALINKKVSDF